MADFVFITGNENKFKEVFEILDGKVERIDLDLSEIQSDDIYKIVKDKASRAYNLIGKPVLVEDIGLYLECLNRFPGPLIKFLISSIGADGISQLVKNYKDKTAVVRCVVCYFDGKNFKFFTGDLKGKIVSPSGKSGFGFDPIFQPDGRKTTLAKMRMDEKNKTSYRAIAWGKFKSFLENKK